MVSNQGLGKTKPTMTKLRNHLQHKEPDGFCLDLLKEKPNQLGPVFLYIKAESKLHLVIL